MRKRLVLVVAAAFALVLAVAAYAAVRATRTGPITASVTSATAPHATASSARMGANSAHQVTARTYTKAPKPTREQLSLVKAGMKEESAPAPNRSTVNSSVNQGKAVTAPNSPNQADTDYRTFVTHNLPTGSIPQGSSYSSFTNEPSVAKAGHNVFMTGNWYAAYSNDGTWTWHFLNPFTIFGSGFCCDQVTLYDKTHDHVYWILQYGNHLTIANAASTNLASWCYYNFYSTSLGQAGSTALDFNDAMIGQRDLYLTTNIFPSGGGYGSEIVRLPLEQMNGCNSVGYNYYAQLDSFTWRLAQGSVDRAYWGSDWDPTGARPNGTSFRVFWWDENSGTIFWYNRSINAFAFYTRNTGQNCASTDGTVKNWCQYADSRTLGAYRANGIVGFSMNAKQGGGFPFPYSVREYFRESDLAYLGNSNLWASWGAIQFLSFSPNSRGHLGGVFYWGGGAPNGTHYYPSTASLVDDDVTPNQPWTVSYWPWSSTSGNTCTYSGLYRWGDYSTTRTNDAADTMWIGTGYREIGNCGTAGSYTQPMVVMFGRARDAGDYNRWSYK
jgi:hypothetical protein